MDAGAGGTEGERAVALVVWFADGARKAKKKKKEIEREIKIMNCRVYCSLSKMYHGV